MIPFLEARYAEEEAAAKAVRPGDWNDGDAWAEFGSEVASHFRRHDPARVLREVEAGRAIIAAFRDEHRGSPDSYDGFWCAILANACAYADHPDYRPYWKLDWKQAL